MKKKNINKLEKMISKEIKYVTTGTEIYLGVLGTSIGGILVGRTLWEWWRKAFGLQITLILGLAIFAITGIYLGRFKKKHLKS